MCTSSLSPRMKLKCTSVKNNEIRGAKARYCMVSLVYSPRQRTKGTTKNHRQTDYEFSQEG